MTLLSIALVPYLKKKKKKKDGRGRWVAVPLDLGVSCLWCMRMFEKLNVSILCGCPLTHCVIGGDNKDE